MPVGGLGHIGLNLMVLDSGEGLYLLDCGVEFPDPNEPGVDQVLPDIKWIESLGPDLKAIILTHGHEDHIGGVVHVLKRIPLPVYGPRLAVALLEEKLEEHGMSPPCEIQVVEKDTRLSLPGAEFEFLRVTHSIPDCFSLAIHTRAGVIIHTGDWKLDEEPVDGEYLEIDRFKALGDKGVSLLLGDSTNAEVPGRTRSEKSVGKGLLREIEGHEGRVIVALFSSNLHRVHLLADIAEKTDRHLVLMGRGLEKFFRVGKRVGLNRVDPSTLLAATHIGHIPPEKLLICCTGTQGEPFSALYRAALGTHHQLEIGPGDLVLHSARKIPGNEGRIYEMFGRLTRKGARVVHGKAAPIHASGHATQEELLAMLEWVRPATFVPVHGEFSFLETHAELARSTGVPCVQVVENGQWFQLENDEITLGHNQPLTRYFHDGMLTGTDHGLGVKERWKLSHTGVIALQVSRSTLSGSRGVTVTLQTEGIPKLDGAFEGRCGAFLEQELAKLPTYTPPADFRDAAKMLARRFAKKVVGKKPSVLLHVTETNS